MLDAAAKSYRDALVRWTEWVRRGAWLVIAASLALTVVSAFYFAGNVRISTSTTDMLSKDLPFRQKARAMSAAFPQFSDNILIVIDGQTPDLADDAALNLAAELRRQPQRFGSVYDPAGSDFFRKNGLLYLDVDELYDLSDRLAEAQPFLGTLWRDPSLRGFVHMLGLAIDETIEGEGEAPIEIARVLNSIAEVAEAQAAGEFRHLSWRRLMTGDEAEESGNRRFLLIQPALDFTSLQPATEAMASIRALVGKLEFDAGHGVTVRLTGSAALAQEELKSVEKGMGLAGLISFTLVVGLLLIGVRSPPLVLAILITLISGLLWTAAFAILALGSLNLISVAFAVLFIGLSVDFGIHYALRYREEVQRGGGRAESLSKTAAGIGGPLTLCAFSAAIAFYSFLPTEYVGLAELGLIAGTGMFIALIANLTLLPALLSVLPEPRQLEPVAERPTPVVALRRRIERHAGAICLGSVLLFAGSIAVSTQARFDFDPLNLKERETESVSTLFDIMKDARSSPYSIEILADSVEAAAALGARLNDLPEVEETVSVKDYVPTDQEEKLDIVRSTALFLAPALAGTDSRDPITDVERAQALETLKHKLDELSGQRKNSREATAAARLSAALRQLPVAAGGELEHRLLSGLQGRLRSLIRSLDAAAVSLETLPADLRERQIAADNRARLEVFPKADLRDHLALEKFVDAVRAVAPDAIGSPVVIFEAGKAVVRAFYEAAIIAVACIMVLLVVVLQRLVPVALVFAPLALAAVMTVAASVLLAMPFNFANVIVLPLLFGLGVAGAIHLVTRDREQRGETGLNGVMQTSTPRAVVFSALTTIGSFGSIALSSHPGTSSMGTLLTVSITLSLLSTLVFLPALMVLVRRPGGTGT